MPGLAGQVNWSCFTPSTARTWATTPSLIENSSPFGAPMTNARAPTAGSARSSTRAGRPATFTRTSARSRFSSRSTRPETSNSSPSEKTATTDRAPRTTCQAVSASPSLRARKPVPVAGVPSARVTRSVTTLGSARR
ncbi:MAG: hypothetical protein QM704_13375 [Anaeromyxobacteraceae bacterium]